MYYPEHYQLFHTRLRDLVGQRVAILGHLRPDGDCIGSQVGLARVLSALSADVVCYNEHRVPPACAGFVGDTVFLQANEGVDSTRVAVSVDCADRTRLGDTLNEAYPDIFLNIDHHISNTAYADHNIIDAESSATGEILAGLCLDSGVKMDAVAAQAFYVGVATDTGQFRFSSTTRRTFGICYQLMENGADPAGAAMQLYENESPSKLALLQRFLASFEYHCDQRVCIGILKEEDWESTGAEKEDTEGLVDYARSIQGVEIGILLEEREGSLKGSFRAKDPVHRVDQIARQFNGGGHACAAGFNPGKPLDEFHPELLKALSSHFEQLDSERGDNGDR